MSEINSLKLAVLIDADNAQASLVAELLAEVAKFGTASIKRAYGDWCKNRSKPDTNVGVRPDAKTEFNRTVKRS